MISVLKNESNNIDDIFFNGELGAVISLEKISYTLNFGTTVYFLS